jgi:hypothetical protein
VSKRLKNKTMNLPRSRTLNAILRQDGDALVAHAHAKAMDRTTPKGIEWHLPALVVVTVGLVAVVIGVFCWKENKLYTKGKNAK